MSIDSKTQISAIFDQLLALRESVGDLQEMEEQRVRSLRGHQTVDVDGSIHLLFLKLQEDIASIEEALASVAEATGDIPKL
ncbi:hypothetical protein [Pseudomonas sp. HY13-MNA-CIBAN-0226]|uniref:hypothetical protein n=1 Tax=Pseudomonas sp. HY13-MNA-CIBAN-0226 TaxID=3140473 RepID=UPI00332EE1A8